MSGFLWAALMFLVAISPLIIFHELGHYWAGRWCGVRAEAFSIGFGRELAGWTDKRGTRWKIGWLPLGGYVKFAGEYEIDGSPAPKQPFDGFETARLWQRSLIVLAGPMANFLLAFVLIAGVYGSVGQQVVTDEGPVMTTTVRLIERGSAAEAAGVQADDRVIAINGEPMNDFMAIRERVMASANQPLRMQLLRAGGTLELVVTPSLAPGIDKTGNAVQRGHIGLIPQFAYARVPLWRVPMLAAADIGHSVYLAATTIAKIFTGAVTPKALGGPLQIARIAGTASDYGPVVFVQFMAFISINLGFMNLLPVPVLDGGQLALYGIEAVRRRPLASKTRETIFRTGLAMLMALFVFVTINDLGSFGLQKLLADLIG